MVASLILATLAAATASPSVAQNEIRIGVAAVDTATGESLTSSHENERFLMCSTFKFLAAAAVLKRVDEGRDQMDRFVRYSQADILDHSPVTKAHLLEGGMNLGALCAAAVAQSDNTAGNLLLDSLGGPDGVTKFARSLGDKVTHLDRKEPELNSAEPGDERDTTTPAAMVADMKQILLGDVLSPASRQQLEKWMQDSVTGFSLIRAAVPEGWVVGDKTGRGKNQINDIAIVRPSGRAPILIVIYARNLSGTDEEREGKIASTAREIFGKIVTPP